MLGACLSCRCQSTASTGARLQVTLSITRGESEESEDVNVGLQRRARMIQSVKMEVSMTRALRECPAVRGTIEERWNDGRSHDESDGCFTGQR